ncbi:acyl-CoA dehydrogenase family protein [Paludisphaera borealis]|uniref:Putative acyl-CoA dehydrogenase FadE10 n=1 Tax=Paludisphaera borealis TaxID=1387353 RepID=A0A1U7CVP8_9BACT|nr:acyl-CoA dehydrogenase family protein [Paludisphaera borealis]APW63005.1 putative acyl-CoA dehydrogenase FadE10 [Paludisphaera borealis]
MSIDAPEPTTQVSAADALRAKQIRQAEELTESAPGHGGFARALFRGEFHGASLFPYPALSATDRAEVDKAVAAVRAFADARIDAAAIDREADIPRSVVHGLAELGVLGMTAPVEFGGRGFSQQGYCRIMEVIGGHCASTAVFINAHHSIGIRALILFGTTEQKAKWLPALTSGDKLAAFALTEEQAGSDASNVQTTAVPSADGKTYILNGTKRYITNGAIADVLTVMARTPDPKGGDSKITAFLVTPDMPGFEVVEARMGKCGIRGTATAKLAFHDMPVPAANILGPVGKGLKVGLTVLDFGRTTFGASCTGLAKFCLDAAVRHAKERRQFGRPLADLELVRKKLAYLAAVAYAMEATTYETAALIDRGGEDYMLETAILKVFSTDALWQGVYETLQVYGGQGYFTDEPYERLMRDARINTIGEGANEVLLSFIALVGMRDVAEGLKVTLEGLKKPSRFLPTFWSFASQHVKHMVKTPDVPVVTPMLRPAAQGLARRVSVFGRVVERVLITHRESVLDRQLILERIADAAIALTTSACTLARIDSALSLHAARDDERAAAELYLRMAGKRFDDALRGIHKNHDRETLEAARTVLRR